MQRNASQHTATDLVDHVIQQLMQRYDQLRQQGRVRESNFYKKKARTLHHARTLGNQPMP